MTMIITFEHKIERDWFILNTTTYCVLIFSPHLVSECWFTFGEKITTY